MKTQQELTEELVRRDPAYAWVVDEMGPPNLRPRRVTGGVFGALVRSITYQQLAGKAAAAIHGRVEALFPDGITPAAVLAMPEEELRAVGLSAAKTASIRDLARHDVEGLVDLSRLSRRGDDEIVDTLCQVRGIGRWTAEMFLIFQLVRPDVWPTGDLAVRAGYGLIHGMAVAPTAKELEPLGEQYRPLRTFAAWYCWRAVELTRRGVSPPASAW